MMKLSLSSIACFFCCIFVSTLVSLPLPRPDQVEILLAFKKEFPSTTCSSIWSDIPTKSWTKDAITFDGVVFDSETGVVTELNLGDGCLSGSFKANSSLFRFQHLRHLDLSSNDLVGEVPSSINLSVNNFSGSLPSSLFTMPFLSYLNLQQNHLKDPLKTMNSSSSSSKLKNLYLSKNLFSGGILKPISKLVSLTYLDLSFNDFASTQFPYEFGNLINLEVLDLHSNDFTGEVPSSICNLTHLFKLDLSNNKFSGSFRFVHNLTKLSSLDLSSNNLSGPIPSFLLTTSSSLSFLDLGGNHLSDPIQYLNSSSSSSSKLQELHLGDNLFSEKILESVLKLTNLPFLDLSFLKNITYPTNFSFLPLKSLKILDLTGNNLSWFSTISDDFLSTELTRLHFSSCQINEFPKFLKKQRNLWWLDIGRNNIKGKVPEWLWNLPSLTHVKISHNSLDSLEGSQEALLNSSVQVLELDSNSFQGSFPDLPPRMLTVLASNNSFSGDIPLSLCNSSTLFVLDLSNNNFSGSIPGCFGELLGVLNLHNNSLSGSMFDSFDRGYPLLTTLDVGHNQITGKLPRSLVNCTSLKILNVESNGIIDTFPFWLKTLPNLEVVFLRSNRFHGSISSPQHPPSFQRLRIIDISSNNFTGTLSAEYFVNWSAALVNMPEVYRLPEYTKNSYEALYQTSIYLTEKGQNMEFKKIPVTYTVIDFSANKLGGQIPYSIGLLKQLVVFNLSNNDFEGHIPSSLAKLTKLESLDLSGNQLSGEIPQELGTLTFLEYIDVSHNKLIGQIPQSTQFGGQPKSSFEGNVGLCGLPLEKSCFEENKSSPTPKSEEQQLLNWKAVAIGYGPGVFIGLVIGQVMASYRPALYYKLFRF